MFYRLIINEAALWTGTLEYRWIKKKQQKKKKKAQTEKNKQTTINSTQFFKGIQSLIWDWIVLFSLPNLERLGFTFTYVRQAISKVWLCKKMKYFAKKNVNKRCVTKLSLFAYFSILRQSCKLNSRLEIFEYLHSVFDNVIITKLNVTYFLMQSRMTPGWYNPFDQNHTKTSFFGNNACNDYSLAAI